VDRQRNFRKTVQPTRRCHRCNGSGIAPCRICGGSGQVLKGRSINGAPEFIRCDGCYGRKSGRCSACHGQRFI
jgi:DnaJ-class molecular chaperone